MKVALFDKPFGVLFGLLSFLVHIWGVVSDSGERMVELLGGCVMGDGGIAGCLCSV